MTRFTTIALVGLMALPPALTNAQTLIQRQGGGDPVALGLMAVQAVQPRTGANRLAGQAVPNNTAGPNTDFCGTGDVFYWYEEDANGNEIDGTRQYGCDYD